MNNSSILKSTLVVAGGCLVAAPATALELGDVKVHSALGQPLRASIAYALAPNEMISDTCVSLQPTSGASGLPSIERGSLIVTDGVIAITGSSIVREPMVSMRVAIRCQYTPQLTRDYMLFIDPVNATPVAMPAPSSVAAQPQLDAQPVRPTRPAAINRDPIANTSRYQVQPGDSASMIAQRIENRPVGLWQAVNAIVAANPDAFIDGDPNKLKAGSWLTIPGFGADAPLSVAESTVAKPVAADPVVPAETSTVYEPAQAQAVPPAEAVIEEPVSEASDLPMSGLQPGDIITSSDNPYIEPAVTASTETVAIPDTQLEGPEITSASPNGAVAVIRQPDTVQSAPATTNWLLWLGSSGVAIALALLLFGRRIRERFGSAPIAPAMPQRRATDGDTASIEAIGEIDIEIDDDAPTGENLALDADLIVGTGLQEGIDVDVAQDFGFAATTELDLELPEEMSSGFDTPETDILPPMRTDEQAILEREILPDDDDYDMSVIVDATKMPRPDDVTERDLEAVQLDDEDETLITGDYTVSQEVDYKIVEQDYEDEMTATQALNAEILKASEDLASLDATSEMPLATVHELDVTAQMPAKDEGDIINDDDDTGINPTVNMEVDDETVNLDEEDTREMPKGKAG